jgi:hypothetical protein
MSAQDDLSTLQANNAADTTALSSLEAALNAPAVPSVGDQVLEAVLPVLTAAGYTVTPPEAPEVPGEAADAEDTAEAASAPTGA